MEVEIKIDTTTFRDRLGRFEKIPEEALDAAGQALYDYLVNYHSQIDWKEGRWFSGAKSGDFAESVVRGWQPPVWRGKTVIIENTFGLLSWKTTGGIITPIRAKYLTIPLIPEVRGRLAAEISSETRLFKAGMALCRKIGKKLEAVYALSRGVRQSPYPKAMPPREDIDRVVERAARGVFEALQ